MKRIESLDYLRGIMAIMVMLYHYSAGPQGTLGGEYILGKIGVYAVSVFYILSGLSLTIVYQDKINKSSEVVAFIIKRIFRILPLYWFALTVSVIFLIIINISTSGSLEASTIFNYKLLLNYSLIYIIIEPSSSVVPVAWSIGNEMVFYVIFPFVFLLSNKYKCVFLLVVFLSLMAGFYFSSVMMNENIPLVEQWSLFINPFNQLFLFMAGCAIGKWGKYFKNIPQITGLFLLIIVFILFWFYPASGDKIQIVTGFERGFFSVLSIIFVMLIYVLNPQLKSLPSKVFCYLGQGCYSIYMLHMLILIPFEFACNRYGLNKPITFQLSFYTTLIISGLTFKYIEKPMMNIGKLISYKICSNKESS